MLIHNGLNTKTDIDVQAAFRRAAKEVLAAAGRGRRLDMEGTGFDR